MSTTTLLGLPFELREQIFAGFLKQDGSVGLNEATWTDRSLYTSPLMQVNQQLRVEAIQIFYRANACNMSIEEGTAFQTAVEQPDAAILSPLPWENIHVLKHVRKLSLLIPTSLPQMHDVAAAFDYGRRMRLLKVQLFINKSRKGREWSLDEFDALREWEVEGHVQVVLVGWPGSLKPMTKKTMERQLEGFMKPAQK